MDERLYWLWLQYVLKTAGETKALLDIYGSAKSFYVAGESQWKKYLGKRPTALKRCSEKSPEDFAETAEFCDNHNLKIITPDSEYYPENLLGINNYPAAIFVRGDYKCLNEGVPLGVIGSRTPCVYGENAAKDIVACVAQSGVLVVSGGALGIDSVAHKTAIANGGKTVLVMGCGHGYDYLRENTELRKNVTKHGACISEYAPFSPVDRNTFPERNRIISGMSKGVVIIEAAERSGTLNTANHARRQGRDLFVLPGDINSGNFAGSNKLITEGASAIFSGENILSKYNLSEKVSRSRSKGTGEVFARIDEKSPEGKRQRKITGKTKSCKAEENKKDE